MKLPEVGSKWVALYDDIESADVVDGEEVIVVDSDDNTTYYKTIRSRFNWGTSTKDWYNNFRQKNTPTESTAEVTGGYDLSDHLEDDQVNSPSHYGQGNIEAIDYIEDFLTKEEYIGYLRGNIAKYLHRFRYKGKAYEDLKKADWYKDRLNKLFEGE